MRACAGRKSDSCTSPLSTRSPRHPLHGQSQHRVQPVFKSQIEDPSRRHPQRQGAKGVHKQPGQKRGEAFGIVKLQSAAPGSSIAGPAPWSPAARSLPADAPASGPAGRLRPPFCASSARRSWALVIQPCSSMTRPSGMRWRCPSSAFPRASISRRTAASTCAAVHAAEQLQPPSKTGAERLRQSFSHPEPQPRIGAGRKDPEPLSSPVRALAGPARSLLAALSPPTSNSRMVSKDARASRPGFRLRRGIVCSPAASWARPPR